MRNAYDHISAAQMTRTDLLKKKIMIGPAGQSKMQELSRQIRSVSETVSP